MAKSDVIAKDEAVLKPNYSEEDEKYIGGLQKRLEDARILRETPRDEFDGMDYLTYFNKNEKLASSFVGAKKNKSDTTYQSGTVRNKLFSFLAAINKMNLEAEVSAFDKENIALEDLGNGMTTILRQSEELDDDDEKRLNRQYELLKQGTVFIEDLWTVRKKTEKKLSDKFDGKLDAKWSEKLVEASAQCERNILWGPGVYLGTMSEYYLKDQPYIFTVDVVPYKVAQAIFGEWDRFKYVSKKMKSFNGDKDMAMYNNAWRLNTVEEDQVEIIRYQSEPDDELQIILNGVLMLPVGFPLTSISPDGTYTIVKQALELIHHKFPYGMSLPMKLRKMVGVYDEMTRLMVLKTQKSFMPPLVNESGRVIGKNVFMPGVISMGFKADTLKMLDERDNGVTNSELGMMQFISEQMDASSINKTFQGQNSASDTATEALMVQEQSNMVVGLTIFMMSLLEKKLADKRLPLLLENWTQPLDTKIDDAKGEIVNRYRTANTETVLPDRGMGRSIVRMKDDVGENDSMTSMGDENPSINQAIFDEEEALTDKLGQPVRIINISPEMIRKRKYIWETNVLPTPARNSNTDKLMFRAKMQDVMTYFPQSINPQYWMNSFAQAWGDDPSKAFNMDQATQNIEAPQPTNDTKGPVPEVSSPKNNQGLLTN